MVSPGFQKHGIVISQIGIKMYVTIPEIGVQVMFSGLIFSVQMPFSKFANNTEGQCGEPQPRPPPGHSPRETSVSRLTLGKPAGGRALQGEATQAARGLQGLLLSVCTKNEAAPHP